MIETSTTAAKERVPEPQFVAAAFRSARLAGKAIPAFPGNIPTNLTQSYKIQDEAIANWPDRVAGWKVGRILGDLASLHGADRLIGPIFQSSIQKAAGATSVPFDAYEGGFCAVEAEYVFELAHDADPEVFDYEGEAALDLVNTLWTGVEIAGSPLATINALGPTVVVSDFGNNKGLILGATVANWRGRLNDFACKMEIDGHEIGTGHVSGFSRGITGSLVFALNCAARRGLPLKAGALISTGAVTGVHDIAVGQFARADFGKDGVIFCHRVGASGGVGR
jgi:2-keto-4-pentenoate hydratase